MKISQNGINLIKKYEGCHLTAYQCPSGIWTIGYGHTVGVKEGMKIAQQQAEELLSQDLQKYEQYVELNCKFTLTQNQFDALVSFTYNCGVGNLKTLIKDRTPEQIADAILLYNKGGGKVLQGLVKRRKEEQALFLSGMEKGGEMTQLESNTVVLKKGSKSDEVKQLQERLYIIGYEPGTADGIFGEKTRQAVISFQTDAGLSPDGIVGKNTWTTLRKIKIYSLKESGNKNITANFKVKEFACKDGSDTIILHEDFVQKLQQIRNHFGRPVNINSAYRTRSHNKKEGGSSNSYHIKGRAFDLSINGVNPNEMAKYAQSIGINGIIRYYWGIHVDSRPKKYWAVNNGSSAVSVKGF